MSQSEIGSCTVELVKVSTNTDGSCRVTFDLPEYESEIASKLTRIKMGSTPIIQLGMIYVGE